MAKNTFVLENVTARELPPLWLKKICPPPGQCFTVHIIFEEISESTLITQKKVSLRTDRIALMREMEKQWAGTGNEDSEEWIKTIKETRTVSEPKHLF